jgi:hypothetical protein
MSFLLRLQAETTALQKAVGHESQGFKSETVQGHQPRSHRNLLTQMFKCDKMFDAHPGGAGGQPPSIVSCSFLLFEQFI